MLVTNFVRVFKYSGVAKNSTLLHLLSTADAFDHKLMLQCLKDIQSGKSTLVPVYDFKTNARVDGEFVTIQPSDVVLLEGILVFYYKEVRDLFDMKLFVDTDADTRLARRGKVPKNQIFKAVLIADKLKE